MKDRRLAAFASVAAALCAAGIARSGAAGKPGEAARPERTPFVYLYDTGTCSSAAWSAQALDKRAGWTVVPEGSGAHEFRGDIAMLNDRILVVLRRQGTGAEVYSRTAGGPRHRAALVPLPAASQRTAGLAAVKIMENQPGAVMLTAAFRTNGDRGVSSVLRLTTGERSLEVRAGEGMGRLLIQGRTRCVVVPDFLADDMVFGPEDFEGSRLGLPAENVLLNLVEGGDAIVMCVWQSNELNADVLFAGAGRGRRISGCQIECAKGKSTWVALLEGSNIWHSRAISAKDREGDIVLDWRPPFPAKWRGSLVRRRGSAGSWVFRDGRQAEHVAPGHGRIVYPCWFESDRAFVRIPGPRRTAADYCGPIIVYPIDRSRRTPLPVFCPVDVLRNALGIGPCQYVLEVEGLGSEAPATPDEVTRWVEKQFDRKRDRRKAGEIKERLAAMVRHIERTEVRIQDYGRFAGEVRRICLEAERRKNTAAAARELRSILDDMERALSARREAAGDRESARRAADAIIALVGKGNASAECERLGTQIRAVGAAQDKTLWRCRMAVRRVKQQCRMAAAGSESPAAVELAGGIRRRAEQMLRKKRQAGSGAPPQ